MGSINVSRVLLGGFVAGLVMNAFGFLFQLSFGDDMEAALNELGVAPPGAMAMATFIVFGFVAGIVLIWLYAAIRPRFGKGIKTALITAVAYWVIASLLTSIGFAVLGLFPGGMMIMGTLFDLVIISIAALVGALVYQEAGPDAVA